MPDIPEEPLSVIARLRSPFREKFGIPRQSGLVPAVVSQLVFEPEFRKADAVRGLEGFSHLWLIWKFSAHAQHAWSPTVRPPRLGGNQRMGVFATRAPFRPNPIGLSCVRLLHINKEAPDGPILSLGGADLLDGTPVYDIKPYLPYTDCIPEATGGFAALPPPQKLSIRYENPADEQKIAPSLRPVIRALLEADPRPAYQDDPQRVYGFSFASCEIRFSVCNGEASISDVISS